MNKTWAAKCREIQSRYGDKINGYDARESRPAIVEFNDLLQYNN